MPGGPWIALNPGATYGDAKQWFAERYIELARKLSRKARIVIIGGPAEADLGRRLAEAVGGLSVAGKTSVSKLAAVLKRADCVILTTAHDDFDYAAIYRNARLIVDTRNAFKGKRGKKLLGL